MGEVIHISKGRRTGEHQCEGNGEVIPLWRAVKNVDEHWQQHADAVNILLGRDYWAQSFGLHDIHHFQIKEALVNHQNRLAFYTWCANGQIDDKIAAIEREAEAGADAFIKEAAEAVEEQEDNDE